MESLCFAGMLNHAGIKCNINESLQNLIKILFYKIGNIMITATVFDFPHEYPEHGLNL